MDYIKANYERVLLLVSGLALAAAAFHLVSGLSALQTGYVMPPAATRGAPFAADERLARLQSESTKLKDPSESLWREQDRSLFASRVYLLRDGQLVDIFESDRKLYPGIDNAWILKHGLDYTDSELPAKDADSDGFTNLEEFSAGTDPQDGTSNPPLWTKLRVQSFEKIPFRLKFMGAPSLRPGEAYGEDTEFSINTLDYSSPTQFLKVGEKIAGTELKIVKAEAKSAVNQQGGTVDVSELTLKDLATGDTIVLVNEKEVDSPYSFAILKNTVSGEEIRVEKGKSFPLGAEPVSYKLIDVGSEGAVISAVGSDGDQLKVPPFEEQKNAASETPQ